MRVRDPVCGMVLDGEEAPVRERYDGLVFCFCASGCAAQFKADPGRYADSASQPPPDEATAPAQQACPACGCGAVAEYPGSGWLGEASLEEVETLARNEWRRRLGLRRYAGAHPRAVVRWALLSVLRPEDDRAPAAVAGAFRAEAVRAGADAEVDVVGELDHLMAALTAVLRLVGRQPGRVADARDRIAAALASFDAEERARRGEKESL